MGFKFEKLVVWQRALELSGRVHQLTRTFPRSERYVLAAQIQRAADSVVLNTAEGSTGQSHGEFKQFIGYAIRSALEVVACLYLAKQRRVVEEKVFSELYEHTEQVVKMLQALRRSI